MDIARRINPITNWHYELSESDGGNNQVTRYYLDLQVEEYSILYELSRKKDGTWRPKITADGHVTYHPLKSFETAEDALAALSKRVGVL